MYTSSKRPVSGFHRAKAVRSLRAPARRYRGTGRRSRRSSNRPAMRRCTGRRLLGAFQPPDRASDCDRLPSSAVISARRILSSVAGSISPVSTIGNGQQRRALAHPGRETPWPRPARAGRTAATKAAAGRQTFFSFSSAPLKRIPLYKRAKRRGFIPKSPPKRHFYLPIRTVPLVTRYFCPSTMQDASVTRCSRQRPARPRHSGHPD